MKFRSIFRRKEKTSASGKLNSNSEVYSDESSSGHSNDSSCSSKHASGRTQQFADWLLEQESQMLAETFRIIDTNGDGRVSLEELKSMWSILGQKVTDQELRTMIHEVDANGNGEIEFDEFLTLNRNLGLGFGDREEEVQLAFNIADVNHDGNISAAELQRVMKKLGKKISLAESSEMLSYADSDHDNLLNYQEFKRLMTSSVFASS